MNTQATTNHKCKSNTNQVSDHQSPIKPKSKLVNEPCAPIYPIQVQVWSSYETRDSGFDPQWSRQFVDPHLIHRPMRLTILKYERKNWFLSFEKFVPIRNGFVWSRHLLLFLFLNGENLSKNKKNPSMTQVRKKRSAKTRFWVWGSGYLLGRYLMWGNTPFRLGIRSLLMNWVYGSIWIKDQTNLG